MYEQNRNIFKPKISQTTVVDIFMISHHLRQQHCTVQTVLVVDLLYHRRYIFFSPRLVMSLLHSIRNRQQFSRFVRRNRNNNSVVVRLSKACLTGDCVLARTDDVSHSAIRIKIKKKYRNLNPIDPRPTGWGGDEGGRGESTIAPDVSIALTADRRYYTGHLDRQLNGRSPRRRRGPVLISHLGRGSIGNVTGNLHWTAIAHGGVCTFLGLVSGSCFRYYYFSSRSPAVPRRRRRRRFAGADVRTMRIGKK